MHFQYVFILQISYNSTCFERPFRSSSGVHDLLYSTSLYKPYKRAKRGTFVRFIHKGSASCWFVYIIGPVLCHLSVKGFEFFSGYGDKINHRIKSFVPLSKRQLLQKSPVPWYMRFAILHTETRLRVVLHYGLRSVVQRKHSPPVYFLKHV
jgi:hypothetical protein